MSPEVTFSFREYLDRAEAHRAAERKLPLAVALPLIAILSAGLWFGIWKLLVAAL